MSALWPTLEDLRLSYAAVSRCPEVEDLSDDAYRAFMRLVGTCAASLVWTYTPPGDGSLTDDDKFLASCAWVGKRRWKRIRREIEPLFDIRGGRWHLRLDWIAVDDRPVRFAIPRVVQEQVRTRQGHVCTYCGSTTGPFEYDHILPVALGGGNDASNLTLACGPCNRSKGARTLQQWMASR